MRRLETLKLLNDALEYIEMNLISELNIDDISKIAGSSKYHFQRIFHVLTGFTVSQYIKNRRLTLAAEELIVEDKRVIDIALKYGYESPEAFTKAFKRMHGIAPSSLRKYDGKIKAFPKISFQISIKGEGEINYKIVEREAFQIFGADFITTTANDAAYEDIPKFISEIFQNGTHDRINHVLGNSKGTLLNGYHYGFKEDGSRKYIMGDEVVNDYIPNGFTILDIQ